MGQVLGSVTSALGFSASDADPSFAFPGASSAHVHVPYRLAFNEPSFTVELWLSPASLTGSAVPSVVVSNAYVPDVLSSVSAG